MKPSILGLSLLFFGACAWAEPAQELKALLDDIDALQGRFTQTVKDQQGEVMQTSQGSFALQRPGYFLWESEQPFAQTIIATPDMVWIYDPDLEQATRRRATQETGNPAALLSGELRDLESEFLVARSERENSVSYALAPRQKDAQYREIVLHFEAGALTGLNFSDPLQQTTRIEFVQLNTNPDLEESVFVFEPPEGTDIIIDE